jgi:hypothetical protein
MDSALENAIRSDDLEGLKTALENGANPNQGGEIYTPLTMIAEDPPAENGLEMIRLLLEKGADANLKDSSDEPKIPLEYAVDALRGVTNQREHYKTQKEFKKDVNECKDIIRLLCPATSRPNLDAVDKKYNGLIPTSCFIDRKPAPIPTGAGKRNNKKKTNKRRKTLKRRRTLKKF